MTEPEAAAKEETRRSRFLGTLAAVFAAVLALAGLAAFRMRDHWMPAPKGATRAAMQKAREPASFPLHLDVEAEGQGLNIRWNPQSVPVTQAREGHLVITEPGQQPQIITLDPAQLASGHVYYQSPAVRLEFRLEVLDSSGTTSRESVLALSSKPAAPLSPQSAGREPSAIRQ